MHEKEFLFLGFAEDFRLWEIKLRILSTLTEIWKGRRLSSFFHDEYDGGGKSKASSKTKINMEEGLLKGCLGMEVEG